MLGFKFVIKKVLKKIKIVMSMKRKVTIKEIYKVVF